MGATGVGDRDEWLRLNDGDGYSNGIYCGSTKLRTDGELQCGNGGTYFNAKSTSVTVGARLYPTAINTGATSLANGGTYTFAAGVYNWAPDPANGNFKLQFRIGTTWYDMSIYGCGFFTDGSNVRLYNTSGSSRVFRFQRMGG